MSYTELARGQVVFAAHSACLRNPVLFGIFTRFFFARAMTANAVRDRVLAEVWEWHIAGGEVATSQGVVLDIERMETLGETIVYSIDGEPIYLEKDVPLENIETAFKASTRRTINRMREKLHKPNRQRVDKRLLSTLFWMDVSKKLIERRETETLQVHAS